jgi:hypothetical protein
MRIALIVFSTILAFSTTASGQSLSGDQIRETLIGNTLSGVEDGKSYSEHLNPDGTISGRSASGSYSGRWRISGNRICFLYAEGSTKSDCTEVSLDGDRITWGDNTTATLSKPARSAQRGAGLARLPKNSARPAARQPRDVRQ